MLSDNQRTVLAMMLMHNNFNQAKEDLEDEIEGLKAKLHRQKQNEQYKQLQNNNGVITKIKTIPIVKIYDK